MTKEALDALQRAAEKRIAEFVNRSAAAHKREWLKRWTMKPEPVVWAGPNGALIVKEGEAWDLKWFDMRPGVIHYVTPQRIPRRLP